MYTPAGHPSILSGPYPRYPFTRQHQLQHGKNNEDGGNGSGGGGCLLPSSALRHDRRNSRQEVNRSPPHFTSDDLPQTVGTHRHFHALQVQHNRICDDFTSYTHNTSSSVDNDDDIISYIHSPQCDQCAVAKCPHTLNHQTTLYTIMLIITL